MTDKTLEYYNQHAAEFCKSTYGADMSEVRNRFLKYLSPGSEILDLGCGSGRDTKCFLDSGYRVTAVDGSPEICKQAELYTGRKVICKTFREIDYIGRFDGIWACSSLLHVGKKDIAGILGKVKQALKSNGIVYVSFKQGSFERIIDGKLYNFYEKEELESLMTDAGFKLLEFFVSRDVREDKKDTLWLNCIAGI